MHACFTHERYASASGPCESARTRRLNSAAVRARALSATSESSWCTIASYADLDAVTHAKSGPYKDCATQGLVCQWHRVSLPVGRFKRLAAGA